MNSEKIILPDFIIADIYKNHLVEPAETTLKKGEEKLQPTSKKDALKKTSLAFLGENKKRVSILVSDPNATFINDNELNFLTKILNACNLNIGDIAIVNTHNNPIVFEQLQQALNPAHLLLIDVKPSAIQLPFNMPDFQVQQFANCTIVCISPLSNMLNENAESKQLKSKLWISLKKAFDL